MSLKCRIEKLNYQGKLDDKDTEKIISLIEKEKYKIKKEKQKNKEEKQYQEDMENINNYLKNKKDIKND